MMRRSPPFASSFPAIRRSITVAILAVFGLVLPALAQAHTHDSSDRTQSADDPPKASGPFVSHDKFVYSQEHYELQREDHPDFTTKQYFQDGHGNHYRKQQGTTNVYYGLDAHNKLLWVNQGMNAAPTSGQANPYRLYTYNGNGEPTQIEHKDPVGGPVITETLKWDGMGKLREVVSTSILGTSTYSALYDGGGGRVQSTSPSGTRTYSYGAGLLHESTSVTGMPLPETRTYTPGVSQRTMSPLGALDDSFVHSDWIGTTRYLTDATSSVTTGYRFDAFGNKTVATGPDKARHQWAAGWGYEADGPLGMHLLGARYYDQSVGRFLNADPIGIAGGINQFAYCLGDPVNAVDPSGLEGAVFYGPNSDITWRGAVNQARRNQQWLKQNRFVKFLVDLTPNGIAAGVVSSLIGEDLLTGDKLNPLQQGLGILSVVPAAKVLGSLGKSQRWTVLNIGCGNRPIAGTINLDIQQGLAANVVGDMQHLPFASNSFEKVVGQLLPGQKVDYQLVAAEAYRVLKPGGTISFGSVAVQFSEQTFLKAGFKNVRVSGGTVYATK